MKIKTTPIIIVLVTIVVGFFLLQSKSFDPESLRLDGPWGNKGNHGVSLQELSFDLTAKNNTSGATTTSLDVQTLIEDTSVYSHPFGFSFQYPKSFHISTFSEGEGEVVLAQNTNGTAGFQIYTILFEGDDKTLTSERLRADIPDLVIEEPEPITVTGGEKGITFISDSGSSKTREVWFIQKGYLFQVTAPLSAQTLLQEILKTWRF